MHVILADELSCAAAAYRNKQHQGEEAELCAWKGALRRSFALADELGVSGVPAGTIMGSTAVVALVVRGRILVANCGDSRAVLCRAGRAVPLSQDNKLARPDELAAAGGVMYHYDVVPRVQGFLSRSRALGHTVPNPKMTCEPDITITARSDDDDCLILASNGLWDVISNQKACNIAKKCLQDKSKGANAPVGKEEEVQCVCAAIRLTNLAINEHSLDDISVVVLDLKVRG
ncbi:probable protein phosphatase 2C 37 [Triticum dicoccoides]|uniref:probable protein phosphatase 2C 37 n=1 Tax=Triticum dicoccoides TaxID=85692 RepID=UPI00188F4CA7|nr:probable protein phosphatase 2C 37 [Triticum dicoccoides]